MTDYPHRHPHDLMSEALLDQLVADAQKWRDLTAELATRGHNHLTTVETIADHFPNFRAMSDAIHAETDQNTAPTLQGPTDPFLDAFLTPSDAEPTQTPREPILSLPEMEIQTIARLNSVFGPVIAGYTVDNLLAFAFEDLREVRTIPLTVLLADLVREMKRTSLSPRNKPTKSTRLM